LALAFLLLPVLLGGVSAARGEGSATQYNKENLAEYESQLDGGQVQSIVVNKRTRSLRITLKNGEHVFVKYAKKTGPKYYAAVKAHHVSLTFLTPAQAKAEQKRAGHKIRYIAGGALILVLAIVGGILYYNRGRQAARG
jgi:Holliday junction resolvase